MIYDWNKQVEITVPTGTNGWIYSGEVIINGVKVRFPVGVPTTVPEPAAALLNKMIELEREDENNTAKPDNHYVGSVTIPEGKTLTLAKGAKVVDEDGVLGGSSTPAPVVILQDAEITIDQGLGQITTPLQAPVAAGDIAQITYDGTTYECTGVVGEGIMFGNFELVGMTGGNPDAPFVVALMNEGNDQGDGTMVYGMAIFAEGSTATTISIVVTGNSADSGNDGGGVFTARFKASSALAAMELSDCDKSMFEFDAAYRAGKDIRIVAVVDETQEYIGRVVCASKPEGDAWVIFNAVVPFGTGGVTNTFAIAPRDGGAMTATKTGSN